MRKKMILLGLYLTIFNIMIQQTSMEYISGYFKRVLSDFFMQADRPFTFVGENVSGTAHNSNSVRQLLCAKQCLLQTTCHTFCFDNGTASCALCHDTFQQITPKGSAPLNVDLRNYTCHYKVNFYAVSAQQGKDLSSVQYTTFPPSYHRPSWIVSNRGPRVNATLAVDGVKTAEFEKLSCIHTSEAILDATPWWYVDLEATYAVFSVFIVNRNDRNAPKRLHDIEVRVGFYKYNNTDNGLFQKNQLCFGIYEHIDLTSVFRSCVADPAFGRYVSLQIVQYCGMKSGCDPNERNKNILIVCEVEVYGVKMGQSYIGDS
ncbi:hypothetical protein CHUAL_010811 [Chamberlinius hualienensis]